MNTSSPPTLTTLAARCAVVGLLLVGGVRASHAQASGSAAAPVPAPVALGLQSALDEALEHNWDLCDARSALAVAEAGLRAAREFPNPVASVSTAKVHVDGRGDATALGNAVWNRAYDSVAQLGQLFEIGGKRGARRQSAAAGVDAARARLADARRTLSAAVVRAYSTAALAEASARIAEQSAGYLSAEARIASRRLEAGDLSRSDRDQIDIAASRLELDAASARADARARRIDLELLLGRPNPAGEIALADSLPALADLAGATAPAPQPGERPDLAAARAELRRSEGELRLQQAERIPDPTLLVQVEHAPPDRPNTVGAGLSFPLPLLNRNSAAIAGARAARDAAAREVRRVEAQAASEWAAALTAREEAGVRWRRYRDELRPRADEIRLAVSLAYEKGGASLLDLLEAQRSDNDVRLETMRAASDAIVADAALKASLTTLSPENARP